MQDYRLGLREYQEFTDLLNTNTMRLFIIALTIWSMCFYGCKNTHKHEHAAIAHLHEEQHIHKDDGHNHEHCHEHGHAEDRHGHGAGEKGHIDEIIFTKAQAARTNFQVEEVRPSSFQQVIKTTGQILPAPGDEWVVVAINNGTISYANHKLVAGSAVKQGESLFYIVSVKFLIGRIFPFSFMSFHILKNC